MDSNVFEDKKVRLVVASALILGILIGLSLADVVFDDYQTGLGIEMEIMSQIFQI